MIIQKAKLFLFILILSFVAIQVNAQCKVKNTAFSSGEQVNYDLYMNIAFFTARAGKGSLTVTEANYRGVNAYKTVMLLNTSGLAGSIYSVSDTLTSYTDKDLRPLLFTKEAHEGDDHSVERQSYSYDGNSVKIRTYRMRNGKERFDEIIETDQCTYDYLSVIPYIRNMDYTGMKQGDKHHIRFISGKKSVNMYVNYLGTSTVRGNDGKKYDVINLSLTILDDAFENQKDALKASLTNDENRIPVIIETVLKKGSVKALLRDMSGVRHP